MKVGFIGAGEMGSGMARNLAKGGHEVTVFDGDAKKLEQLGAEGLGTAHSIEGAASGDAIILCLPNSDANAQVCYGQGGLLGALKAGQMLIDCGTSRYEDTLKLYQECKAVGASFIDAPISGLPQRASSGELTIMCGADKAAYDKAKPLFECMGTTIVYMGQPGNGQLTKLINQLLLNISCAAIAEVIPMAVKLGLDPEQLTKVINNGTGRSHASEFFLPRILENDFTGSLSLEIAYKDMQSIASIAAQEQFPLPVLSAADSTYRLALKEGHGKHSKSGMIKVFEKLHGVEVRKTK